MDVASDTPGPHESSANESSAGTIVGKDNGSKLMDDSPLVRSLFEPPGDLMCPITLELFKDPVSTAAGQVYERSAILSYWRMVEVAVDPLTRKELGSASLTPIHLIRSRARDYREQVARACVDLACSQNVFTPARYLRRAVHLLTDVEIQVNGLTAECVQFVQAHPDADDDRRILRSFSTSLYESGQAEAAAHVIGHLLQGEDRKGQVELMRQCCKYLGASRESMDAAAEKLAGFVQRQEALAAEEMIEVVQEADADLQLLMKLCERLLVDAPGAGLTQEQRGLIAKYVTISWAHLNRRVGVLEEASAASVEPAQPVKQHGAAPAGPWYRAWLQDRRRAGATAAAAVLWVLAGTSPVVRVARVLPVLYLLHRR